MKRGKTSERRRVGGKKRKCMSIGVCVSVCAHRQWKHSWFPELVPPLEASSEVTAKAKHRGLVPRRKPQSLALQRALVVVWFSQVGKATFLKKNPLEPKDGLCTKVAGCGPTLLIRQHNEKSLNSVQQGLMTEGRSFSSKEMFHVVKYSLFNYKHAIFDSSIHAQIFVFDPIYWFVSRSIKNKIYLCETERRKQIKGCTNNYKWKEIHSFKRIMTPNPFILAGLHSPFNMSSSVCDRVIPRLHERAGGFRTSHWATGERHHSLSFSSLWKSIIGIHVLIHVSPCLPGEMPEAQICIHPDWIRRFWNLCRTPRGD